MTNRDIAAAFDEVADLLEFQNANPFRVRAYRNAARKIGDYATAAAAVVLTMNGGKVATCSIGLTNVAETPLWAEEAGKILTGSALDAATVKKAVAAAEAITSPASDGRGPAAYRTKMAGVMLTRAIARAKARAGA